MSEEKGLEIEIEEVEEVQEVEVFETEGLSEGELELAKEHGLVDEKKEEDGKQQEQSETKTEDIKGEEEEIVTDPDNFEDMDKVIEKDEKKFHETYSSNQKALYFKSKANIKKRQDAIKERDEALGKLEDAIKGTGGQKKLDKIANVLANNKDELTVEMLQSIIDEKELVEEPSKADAEAQTQALVERIQQKNKYAEQIGNAKHKNFAQIAQLANELYQEDRQGGAYRSAIDSAYSDAVDEAGLVETIVRVAKFHPKFTEVSEQVNSEEKDKVDRAVANSKKKVSSAAIAGNGGRRIISEDELTCDQVAHKAKTMSTVNYEKFWGKLKESTRKRIMKGIDP